ncbi:hypothetical protein HMPREF0240_02595 [Clostridium sp. D5]|nr:hypothetical protein HMPREF0240_02595 [Clostridium sp. D5]
MLSSACNLTDDDTISTNHDRKTNKKSPDDILMIVLNAQAAAGTQEIIGNI